MPAQVAAAVAVAEHFYCMQHSPATKAARRSKAKWKEPASFFTPYVSVRCGMN